MYFGANGTAQTGVTKYLKVGTKYYYIIKGVAKLNCVAKIKSGTKYYYMWFGAKGDAQVAKTGYYKVGNYYYVFKKGVAYTNYREYSEYKFTTDSVLTDGKNYDATDYTEDNGNVVMVTYKKGDDIVRFVLNYNIDAVDVRLEDGTVVTIGRYGYHRIDN
jgi:hypothetical protein